MERLPLAEQWLAEADTSIRSALRHNPVMCLFAAVAVGYSVGRLIARR